MSIAKQLFVVGIVPGLDSLSLAIRKRHVVLIDLLRGVVEFDPDQSDSTDVLLEAISWGNVSMVQTLLEFGCFGPVITIDAENLGTSTSHNGNKDDIRLHMKQCPRPPHYHRYEVSPLSFAILRGDNDTVKFLLSAFTTESFAGDKGWCVTALTACVVKQNTELLKELLERGVDPFDNSAMYAAVVLGRKVFAKVLIDAFMRRYPKGCALFGSVALVYAIRFEDLEMLRLLAGVADAAAITVAWARGRDDWMPSQSERKADQVLMGFRHRSPFGEAILMHCRSDGASEALPILLTHVNNPDIVVAKQDGLPMTGLLNAIVIGSLQAVRMLVAAGANMSPSPLCGIRRTPLQAAVEAGRVEIVQFLLEQGVDPNEPPAVRMGATSLQLAAIKGFVGIATTLLDKGAAINAEPALMQGRTAFEGATEHGRIEIMILLFQNGADLLSNNRRQHERAIEFAEINRNYAAVQLAGELLQEAVNQERAYLWKEMGAEMPGIDIDAVDTSSHRN